MDRVTAQSRAHVVCVARHFIEVHYKTSTSLRWIWGPARKPLVCFNKVYRGVRQRSDYQAHNLKDGGSNPSPATSFGS